MTNKANKADWPLAVAAEAARALFKAARPEVVIDRLVQTTRDGGNMWCWTIDGVREEIANVIRATEQTEGFLILPLHEHGVTLIPPGMSVTRGRPTLTVDVLGCARCEHDHQQLVFEKFDQACGTFQYWAMCPASGQPVLLSVSPEHAGDSAETGARS